MKEMEAPGEEPIAVVRGEESRGCGGEEGLAWGSMSQRLPAQPVRCS